MVVGITGQTGSGKSTVVKMLGFAGIDADKVAHEVLREKEVKAQLCERFGDDILDEQGEIMPPCPRQKGLCKPCRTVHARRNNLSRHNKADLR